MQLNYNLIKKYDLITLGIAVVTIAAAVCSLIYVLNSSSEGACKSLSEFVSADSYRNTYYGCLIRKNDSFQLINKDKLAYLLS